MIKQNKIRWLFLLTMVAMSCTVHAELQERKDGQAYYDTELDITWLANAHLAATESFGVSGISATGKMNWLRALYWITAMNADNYLGVNTWRLPKVNPLNGVNYQYAWTSNGSTDNGVNISAPGTLYEGSTANELSHLFYNTLGHTRGNFNLDGTHASCATSGSILVSKTCMTNNGPFSTFNLMAVSQFWTSHRIPIADIYWNAAFSVSFYGGWVSASAVGFSGFYAWAVVDGDPFGVTDRDGDGFADDIDMCPDSDTAEIVAVNDCDTVVLNTLDSTGCTINDQINICMESNNTHGQYMKCATGLVKKLYVDNALRAWEKGSILSCVARY